jgi:hypothetical protein
MYSLTVWIQRLKLQMCRNRVMKVLNLYSALFMHVASFIVMPLYSR